MAELNDNNGLVVVCPRDGDVIEVSVPTKIVVRRLKLDGKKKRFVLCVDPNAVRHEISKK